MPRSLTRGTVVIAALDPVQGSEQAGIRPAIIVSESRFNETMPIMTIVPVTSRSKNRRAYPSEVAVAKGEGGLQKESLALCHQVRTISSARIRRQIGEMNPATMVRVNRALRIHLAI